MEEIKITGNSAEVEFESAEGNLTVTTKTKDIFLIFHNNCFNLFVYKVFYHKRPLDSVFTTPLRV